MAAASAAGAAGAAGAASAAGAADAASATTTADAGIDGLPDTICDPHFHMWTVERPNANLGDIVTTIPHYRAEHAAAEWRAAGLRVVAAVHVETVVGQCEGGAVLDEVGETAWVAEQAAALAASGTAVRLVAYLNLARADAPAVLQRHIAAARGALAGVRMILNYDDDDATICWPQVGRGDFLTGGVPSFRAGFALLEKHDLSFDLQCNPRQLAAAAAFLADFKGVRVVMNHAGCLRLGRGDAEDAAALATWRAGMAALAALPNVTVKVSMLAFTRPGWATDAAARAQVGALVAEVIDTFTPARVMFASNFPVDKATGTPLAAVYRAFRDFTARYSDRDRRAMFRDTAAGVYRLPLP